MFKKAAFSSALIVIVIAFIIILSPKESIDNAVTLSMPSTDTSTSLEESTQLIWELLDGIEYEAYNYTFSNGTREVTEKTQATDFIHTVDVLKEGSTIGQLTITIRQIDNADVLVFSRFTNTSDTAYTIPLKLSFANQQQYELFAFQQEIPQEHDRVFGIDHTTNVKGVFSFNNSPVELMLSQNYISRELVQHYDSGDESVVRELVNEDLYMNEEATTDRLTFHLKLRTTAGNQISENWFMLGNKALFNSEEQQLFYKNYTNHYFIRSQKWLVYGGNYSKLPWSIEPATKLGYGRNIVQLKDKNLLDKYQQTNDRFYYNITINSVNNLFDFKGDNDLWLTEYTSAWLKREYGILAPYTDTRHNENVALFLSQAGEVLNNEELKQSYLNYADFLANQQAVGNILSTENGYYILDYYSPTQTKKTHVSLNHALGEMNFLFNAYSLSNNETYFKTALAIKAAVEDIGTKWLNPSNGDLWYQINGDYSLQDTDYETLTLEDLLTSLEHYTQYNLPVPALYDTLIESKIGFIKATNISISSPLYMRLMETKYAHLIENYRHVFDHDDEEE